MMSCEDVLRGLFLDDANPSGKLEPDQIRSTIAQTPVSEVVYFLQKHQDELSDVSAKNIPQFSNVDEVDKVLSIIIDSGLDKIDFLLIGSYLRQDRAKDMAYRKYGENHYKLCAQLGFVFNPPQFQATRNGYAYHRENDKTLKKIWFAKMILHVPIVQQAIFKVMKDDTPFSIREYMDDFLSQSTVIRRLSNMKKLFQILNECSDEVARAWITRINF